MFVVTLDGNISENMILKRNFKDEMSVISMQEIVQSDGLSAFSLTMSIVEQHWMSLVIQDLVT